jgi:hypothetical protein
MIQVALADDERRNQLCVRVQCDESLDVTQAFGSVTRFHVIAFLADEPPYLLNLDILARQVAHLFVHDALAGVADAHAKTHNRVLIDASVRSIARMLLPSASMEITATFFSILSLFAISFLKLTYRNTESILGQHLFPFYAKYFMKPKMGRPKVAKHKLRGIIVNARLSPEESGEIQAAIKASPDNQSDWIRKALLSAARVGK